MSGDGGLAVKPDLSRLTSLLRRALTFPEQLSMTRDRACRQVSSMELVSRVVEVMISWRVWMYDDSGAVHGRFLENKIVTDLVVRMRVVAATSLLGSVINSNARRFRTFRCFC